MLLPGSVEIAQQDAGPGDSGVQLQGFFHLVQGFGEHPLFLVGGSKLVMGQFQLRIQFQGLLERAYRLRILFLQGIQFPQQKMPGGLLPVDFEGFLTGLDSLGIRTLLLVNRTQHQVPFGQIRIGRQGRPGGGNGLRIVSQAGVYLGQQQVGIGEPGIHLQGDLASFNGLHPIAVHKMRIGHH